MHDLFAQCDILVPRSIFRSFTVVNVRSRRVPADQAPLFVMEGLVADQKPPILPVLAQGPQLSSYLVFLPHSPQSLGDLRNGLHLVQKLSRYVDQASEELRQVGTGVPNE